METKYLVVSGSFADFVSTIEEVRNKVKAVGSPCSIYVRCGTNPNKPCLGYKYFFDMTVEELE